MGSLESRARSLYDELLKWPQIVALGYGPDHLSEVNHHWPLAYATLALASVRRFEATDDALSGQCALKSAECLVLEAEKGAQGLYGLGIPVSRDTFRLGVPTEARTVMVVPSAFAMLALSDVAKLKLCSDATRNRLVKAAAAIGHTIQMHCVQREENKVWVAFGVLPAHRFPVINANALCAGAFFEVAQMLTNEGLHSNHFHELGQMLKAYVLDQKQKDQEGVSWWRYYGHHAPDAHKGRRHNDLLHEAYVWFGLSRACSLKSKNELGTSAIVSSLSRFCYQSRLIELPTPYVESEFKRLKRSAALEDRLLRDARVWSVASALAVTAADSGSEALTATLLGRIEDLISGRSGPDLMRTSALPRHYCSLLWGLSSVGYSS